MKFLSKFKKALVCSAIAIGATCGALAEGTQSTYLDLSPATSALNGMKTEVTTWIGANAGTLIWFACAFLFLAIVWLVIKLFKRGSKG